MLQGRVSQRATLNLLLASNLNPEAAAIFTRQLESLNKQIAEREIAAQKAEAQVTVLNRHFSPVLTITDTPHPSESRRAPASRDEPPTNCRRHTTKTTIVRTQEEEDVQMNLEPRVLVSHTFKTLAINTNCLGDVMKQTVVSTVIASLRPSAWVINESKPVSDVGVRIPARGYKIHESHGVKTEGKGHSGKWGVIVRIRDSLHAQRVEVSSSLQGRAVVLDIIISTSNGKGFCQGFNGIYALWNPGEEESNENLRLPTVIESESLARASKPSQHTQQPHCLRDTYNRRKLSYSVDKMYPRRTKINSALLGGSAKRLFSAANYDPPPLVLSSADDPTTVVFAAFNRSLLTLPLFLRGFDFPSISRTMLPQLLGFC
ncbi:hypothetical protein R3P38DRAFT_3206466 [Favolaschia claudopus]|uniref:Uncharacterized protein n=1 Tax=Favolaschia claudopus TaxID=2862362 RepID=A0AAW0AL39_9AGAR